MKHMKLVVVLVAATTVLAVSAGVRMERAKNFLKVGFHCGEVVGGYYLFKFGSSNWDELLKGKWSVVGSALLMLNGLHGLKNDLHQHMFYHLEAWYNYKKQNEQAAS